MNAIQLATASNGLVYSAVAVYTFALVAFAVDLSRTGTAVTDRTDRPLVPNTTPPVHPLLSPRTQTLEPAGAPVQQPGGSSVSAGRARPGGISGRAAGVARSLTWLAFVLHTSAVAARAAAVGRPPWGNMYEFAVSGAAVVAGVYLATSWRGRHRYLGAFVVGPVLLTLGLALSVLYTDADQLVPALHSYWLAVHVSVAFVASALFTLGFSASVLQLVQGQRGQDREDPVTRTRGRLLTHLPDAEALEQTAYRFHAVAFPLWTFALMSGAIWAEAAWGRYWGWDPKEVWSFIVWVLYAAYLHARATRGWTGRKAAFLSVAGYSALLFNFGVVNIFVVGLHSYAGVS